MERVYVDLGERAYSILVGEGLLGRAAEEILALGPWSSAIVVTHPGLASPYADPIVSGLCGRGLAASMVLIPAGERYKNLAAVSRLYDAFLSARLDRRSVVVAVGGGVLGDVVGFASATYLRGIAYVQVPTTLLAQVDSSVGGKTGVDLARGKNLVGAFHQPRLVLADIATLRTLPRRELRAGLAEVVKYGIIHDESLFRRLRETMPQLLRRSSGALVDVVRRSCEIKAEVVSADETEAGLRAILNFGHTIGHALEAVTHYRRYRHGEAIAIGMVSACLIGEEVGVTPPKVTGAVEQTLSAAGLPTAFPADIDPHNVLAAAATDKKARAGKLHFVLAREIGSVFVTPDVSENAVLSALRRQTSQATLAEAPPELRAGGA